MRRSRTGSCPPGLERIRRKLADVADGDRQMVKILATVLSDGLSAVEAQAMGTPVVVSDLGAIPETVLAPPDVPAQQRTGWRVPPGDAPALAEALKSALNLGASGRDTMNKRARAHVESKFSLDHMLSATLEVYGEALSL